MLKIQSLQRRLERYVIVYTWKILNNITNNYIGLSFTDIENSSRTGVTATVPHFPRNFPTRVISDMTSSTDYSGVNHNSILDWAKQNN